MSNCKSYSFLGSRPKNVERRNHFQVEVRAKKCRHQAENIFVMSRLFWDQDHVGNHFQVFKKVVDIKQKIFFDISRLFWDQDHVERSFKFLKKVRAKS